VLSDDDVKRKKKCSRYTDGGKFTYTIIIYIYNDDKRRRIERKKDEEKREKGKLNHVNRERTQRDHFHREKQLYRRTYVRSMGTERERERKKKVMSKIINYLLD